MMTPILKAQAPHLVGWLVVLVFVLAGCAAVTGSPPASFPPATGSASATAPAGSASAPAQSSSEPASSAVSSTPSATASSTPSTEPAATDGPAPPDAVLLGTGSGPAMGALGTFSWDGLVSDSPWIVPRRGVDAAPGTPLRVRFASGPAQVDWTARWARIRGGEARTPRAAGSGDGGRIRVDAPVEAGDWSLQLEARFPGGGRAAWYWRVVVGG